MGPHNPKILKPLAFHNFLPCYWKGLEALSSNLCFFRQFLVQMVPSGVKLLTYCAWVVTTRFAPQKLDRIWIAEPLADPTSGKNFNVAIIPFS
jgi:hypothetical protein